MEKKRVPKGERYWYLTFDDDGLIFWDWVIDDYGGVEHKNRYDFNNYFYSATEAESIAKKIRAILKGAEVIEMPDEEEVEDAIADEFYDNPYTTEKEEYAFRRGVNWLKSKIVK